MKFFWYLNDTCVLNQPHIPTYWAERLQIDESILAMTLTCSRGTCSVSTYECSTVWWKGPCHCRSEKTRQKCALFWLAEEWEGRVSVDDCWCPGRKVENRSAGEIIVINQRFLVRSLFYTKIEHSFDVNDWTFLSWFHFLLKHIIFIYNISYHYIDLNMLTISIINTCSIIQLEDFK